MTKQQINENIYALYRNRLDNDAAYDGGKSYTQLMNFLDQKLTKADILEGEELVMELIEEIKKQSYIDGLNAFPHRKTS